MNINDASKCINQKNRTTGYSNSLPNSTCPLNSCPLEDLVFPKYAIRKVRAPSGNYRAEQQIRSGGKTDFWTETSRMIDAGAEMEVVRVNDVGCDHTSDRRSRRGKKDGLAWTGEIDGEGGVEGSDGSRIEDDGG